MGYAKVVKITDRKVRLEHQLNSDGTAYAEDVTIEVADSVDPSRIAWLTSQDGKVGIASFGFSPATYAVDGALFPSDIAALTGSPVDPDADDGTPEPDPADD